MPCLLSKRFRFRFIRLLRLVNLMSPISATSRGLCQESLVVPSLPAPVVVTLVFPVMFRNRCV